MGDDRMPEDAKAAAARAEERRRCASIMALPDASKAPKAAADIAFGSNATVAEARTALKRAADAAMTGRERGRASMAKILAANGLKPNER